MYNPTFSSQQLQLLILFTSTKGSFFGGISVGANQQMIQNINGEFLYVNKKRNAYGFGVGLNPDFQPIYTGRLYWKIGK